MRGPCRQGSWAWSEASAAPGTGRAGSGAPEPAAGTAPVGTSILGVRPLPHKTTRFCLREGKQAPACCHAWCRVLLGGSGPSQEPGVRPAPGVTRWGAGSRPCWAAGVGCSTLASPCATLGWGQAGLPAGVLPAPALAQSGPQRLGVPTGSLAAPREATALGWWFLKSQECCGAWACNTWALRAGGQARPRTPLALPFPTISALLQGPLRVLSLLRGQQGRKGQDKASRGWGYLADLWRGWKGSVVTQRAQRGRWVGSSHRLPDRSKAGPQKQPNGPTRCQRLQRHRGSQTPRHVCRHA